MASEVTPRVFAMMHGVHINTVYYWIQEGVIPCRRQLIFLRHRYYIPIEAKAPVLKPGPHPHTPPRPLLSDARTRTRRYSKSMNGSHINWDNLHRKKVAAKKEALQTRRKRDIMEEQ